jgi:kynurenine 3-monooxygenase
MIPQLRLQGVNSGLEDVYTLYHAMKSCENNISTALPLYEQQRQPEAVALCKLMQFGYPYQYNQAPLRGKLCLLNFAFRLLINKLLPIAFDPPAFLMVMRDHNTTYAEVRMLYKAIDLSFLYSI